MLIAVLVPFALVLCVEGLLRLGFWRIEPSLRLDYQGFIRPHISEKSGAFKYLFERDRDLFWRGRPGAVWIGSKSDPSKQVRMNSLGFRCREFSIKKPSSVFRVVCLGDSRTFGMGVSQEQTYPSQLERLLQKRCPNKRIEVINCGILGYTVFQGWQLFERRVTAMDPDVVTVLFDFNDQLPAEHPDSVYYYNAHSWAGRLKQKLRRSKLFVVFENLVLRIRAKLRPKPAPEVLVGADQMREEVGAVELGGEMVIKSRRVNEPEYRQTLAKLIDACKSRGILPVVISLPRLSFRPPFVKPQKYYASILSVGREHGVAVIDLLPVFLEYVGSANEALQRQRAKELLFDNCHPTALGDALIARAIARWLADSRQLPC